MPHHVVVTDFLSGEPDVENQILSDLADVAILNSRHEEELFGRVEQADAIMVYHTIPLSRRLLDRLERCRLIVRCGVGFDNVDHAHARTLGIPVANVPNYGTEEVADSAIGLTLALSRGIAHLNSLLRDNPSQTWHYGYAAPLPRLRGKVYGIVGLGRIGTASAVRAKALGMDVVFYDPYRSDGYDKALGIRRAESLEELLRQSHVLTLHCPLSPETHHLIGSDQIALMPSGSYLVNTARGGVLDTTAIPAAIASGQLAGAGIDVLEEEPPSPDHPLLRAWRDPSHPAHHRVLLNPHSAFYCEQGLHEMRELGAKNVRRVLLGQPPRNVVNGVA